MDNKEIKNLVSQHGEIIEIEIKQLDEVLFLRPIDRVTFTSASKFMASGDSMTAVEVILRALTVHGDVERVCDEKNFKALLGCAEAVTQLMEIKGTVIKKHTTDTK